MTTFYEEKEFDGAMWFRLSEGGAWSKQECPIDTLLLIVQSKLGFKTRIATMDALLIDAGTVSRIRMNKLVATERIILNAHEVAGIAVAEIRRILKVPSKVL
jgi:hypothetical protein